VTAEKEGKEFQKDGRKKLKGKTQKEKECNDVGVKTFSEFRRKKNKKIEISSSFIFLRRFKPKKYRTKSGVR
jgi:hypothetical protein